MQEKLKLLEVNYAQNKGKSLLKAVLYTFKKEFAVAFGSCLVGTMLSFLSPFIINMIITFLESKNPDSIYGFQLLGILIATQLVSYLIFQHVLFYQCMIGVRSTNALIAMIYQKQLKLTAATNKQFSSGEIVNFVQVDSEQLFYMCFDLTNIAQMPMVIIYSFTFLFYTLGLSFFSGIGVFIIAFASNVYIGLKLEKVNCELMKRKDLRMNHTTEALSNIKVLKFYSWTHIFEEEIHKRRVNEFKKYWEIAIWLALIITSLYFFSNILSSVVFTTYIGSGQTIDLATSFTCLIFFNIL